MRKIFTLFMGFILISSGVQAKSPRIVWEKTYQPVGAEHLDNFKFKRMDQTLTLIYSVNKSFLLNNPGFIQTGIKGEKLFEYELPGDNNIIPFEAEIHGNWFYLYNDTLDHDLSKLLLVRVQMNTSDLKFVMDTSLKNFVGGSNLSQNGESLFMSYFDRENFHSLFRVYDRNLSFIKSVTVDPTTYSDYMLPGASPRSTILSTDGNYITFMTGSRTLNRINPDTTYSVMCEIDEQGKILWKQPLKNSDTSSCLFKSITELSSGEYFSYGYNFNPTKDFDNYYLSLAKVSASGALVKYITFPEGMKNQGADVIPLYDGRFYAIYGSSISSADPTKKSFWLKFLDENFSFVDEYFWDADSVCQLTGIAENDDNTLFVSGQINNNELYLAEIKPDFLNSVIDNSVSTDKFEVFPDPADEFINVGDYIGKNYRIIDVLGNITLTGVADSDLIDISSLTGGFYEIIVDGEGQSRSAKFVKE